jgi:hypothetical protein
MRSVGRRVAEIARASRAKGDKGKEKIQPLYRKLAEKFTYPRFAALLMLFNVFGAELARDSKSVKNKLLHSWRENCSKPDTNR